MPVGSKTSSFMAHMTSSPGVQASIEKNGIKQFRQEAEAFFDTHAMPLATGIEVTKGTIESPKGHKIGIKIYKPEGVDTSSGLPMLVFFSGGASVLDLKRAYDGPCSEMAKRMNGVVIKVSCRLAPEHHRLQAFDDATVAIHYLYDNAASFGGSQEQFVVGGNSSGAHLAALVVNKSKQKNQHITIAAQLLITPSVDMSLELRKFTPFKSF